MSLRSDANLVRNATQVDPPENDEDRIGGLFQDIADISETVNTISALKSYADSSAGDIVNVKGYNTEWDGGGGLFRRVEAGEIISNGGDAGNGGTNGFDPFSTVNYPLDVICGDVQPWTHRGNDLLYWEGGAVWTPQEWIDEAAGSEVWTQSEWTLDASIAVADGEAGFIMPEVEGWRVLPTYGAYDNSFFWERVLPSGQATPEMFGGQSSLLGESGSVDASPAFQGLADSPYNAQLNGKSYCIKNPVYWDYEKTINGVNAQKTLRANVNDLLRPSRSFDNACSTIWTDVDTDIFIFRNSIWMTDIKFDVQFIASGNYNSSVIDWWICRPMLGGGMNRVRFRGNNNIQDTTSAGGNAIQLNLTDDFDVTVMRPRGTDVGGAYLSFVDATDVYIDYFNRGFHVTEYTNPETGLYVNGNHWNLTITACKEFYRVNTGGTRDKYWGHLLQDTEILTFDERNTFANYFRNCAGTFDYQIGDMGQSPPSEDPADYPAAHANDRVMDYDGDLQFIGNGLEIYGKLKNTNEYGTRPGKLRDNDYVEISRSSGVNGFRRKVGGSLYHSWIDNALNYSALRHSVFINALAGGAGFDYEGTLTSQRGTLSSAANIALTNEDNLFDPLGLPFQITYQSGMDTTNDFVEVEVDLSPNDVRSGDIFISGNFHCNAAQVILRGNSGSNLRTGTYIDTSSYDGDENTTIQANLALNEATDLVLVRFIGGVVGETTIVDEIRLVGAEEKEYLPFIGLDGGRAYGDIQAPSFTVDSGPTIDSGTNVIERVEVTLTQSEILNLNTSPKLIGIESNRFIISWFIEVTAGSTNYDTNTELRIRQAQSNSWTYTTFDIANLPGSGNNSIRILEPPAERTLLNTGQDMDVTISNGDPLNGDKEFKIVLLCVPF